MSKHVTTSRGRRLRRRLHGALALTLAGALLGGPALADDLHDIRDRIRKVEQQQDRAKDDRSAATQQAGQLGDELEHTSAELVAADERLRETTAKVADARVALGEAEADLADAEAEARRIEAELAVARANEAQIEESLAANEDAQAESRSTIGAIARDSYKQGGLGSLATTLELLSGESDAVEQMAMARTVLRVQDQQILALSVQQAQAVAEQDRLAGVRRDIDYLLARAEANVVAKEQARQAAEEAKSALEALEAQQAQDKAALEKEKAKVEKALAAEQRRADDLTAQLRSLASKKHGLKAQEQVEVDRIAREKAAAEAAAEARLRAEARRRAEEAAARQQAAEEAARQRAAEREAQRQREAAAEAQRRSDQAAADEANRRAAAADAEARRAQDAAADAKAREDAQERARRQEAVQERAQAQQVSSSGYLSQPMPGGITSEFGMRLHPILGIYVLHSGIDFGAACGTPVAAAADGVVWATPYDDSRGNHVIVDHGVQRGVNLTTAYLHLSSFAVSPGQSVARGQVIGYEGTTGSSTGCHLHFETRENGTPVNPRNWL
ncbi:M23 family metallopeptidase [Ornithinimicrobium avium]|nr:M23 family metallopeptidase [Ornithinimicrobium avium]